MNAIFNYFKSWNQVKPDASKKPDAHPAATINDLLNRTFNGEKVEFSWNASKPKREITIIKRGEGIFDATTKYLIRGDTLSKEVQYLGGLIHYQKTLESDEQAQLTSFKAEADEWNRNLLRSVFETSIRQGLELTRGSRQLSIEQKCRGTEAARQYKPLLADKEFVQSAQEIVDQLIKLEDYRELPQFLFNAHQKITAPPTDADLFSTRYNEIKKQGLTARRTLLLAAMLLACPEKLADLTDKLEVFSQQMKLLPNEKSDLAIEQEMGKLKHILFEICEANISCNYPPSAGFYMEIGMLLNKAVFYPK
jgi:hypothetical protein